MADSSPPGGPGAERRVVVAVALGVSLAPLNSTMLIVALPRILDDFGADLSAGGWLITGYLIAVAAVQTPAGKLGDRFGHRTVFLGGLAAFLAVSLAAAASPVLPLLVVLRMAQGVAVAAVFPNGWALLRTAVPAARRAARFGLVGSVLALSVAAGPVLAGVAVDVTGWRSVFLVNLAVAGPALVAGRRIAPAPRPAPAGAFDVAGALGWAVLLVAAAGLVNVSTHSPPPGTLAAGVAALAVAGVLLVRRELAHPDPVVQPRFFNRLPFAAANAASGFGNLAWYVTLIAVALVMEGRPGSTGLSTGLVLSAPALAFMVLAPVGGRIADRLGRRRPAVAGMTMFAAGLVPLAAAGSAIPVALLVAGLVLTGSGFALATPAIHAAALESVRPEESGAAGGVYSTSRYLGSILGSSLLAAAADPTGRLVFSMVVASAILAAVSVGGLPRATPAPAPAVPAPPGGATSPA